MPQPVLTTSWTAYTGWPTLPRSTGMDATAFVPCGVSWDAVALPLARGLAALDALALPIDAGYQVVADYYRAEVYVLVHPRTGHLCAMPGVRVLTVGSWLLVPGSPLAGVSSATWLGEVAPDRGRLVRAARLAKALHDQPPASA